MGLALSRPDKNKHIRCLSKSTTELCLHALSNLFHNHCVTCLHSPSLPVIKCLEVHCLRGGKPTEIAVRLRPRWMCSKRTVCWAWQHVCLSCCVSSTHVSAWQNNRPLWFVASSALTLDTDTDRHRHGHRHTFHTLIHLGKCQNTDMQKHTHMTRQKHGGCRDTHVWPHTCILTQNPHWGVYSPTGFGTVASSPPLPLS